MVLSFIRVTFVMLSLSFMVDLQDRIFSLTVFVASPTPLNMLSVALTELSQPYDIMTYVRDLMAELMLEVCYVVSKEPSLQPLSGELLSLHICNWDDGVHLGIKASGFWGDHFQPSLFEIRIFNPYVPSTTSMNVQRAESTKSKFVRLNSKGRSPSLGKKEKKHCCIVEVC